MWKKDALFASVFLALNGAFIMWIVRFERLKREVVLIQSNWNDSINEKNNLQSDLHVLQNDVTACNERGLSECGPSQKVEDGKCKIDFEGERDVVYDLCHNHTPTSGAARITDLQNNTKQGQKIPRMMKVGYKNGQCDDQMYAMYLNHRDWKMLE